MVNFISPHGSQTNIIHEKIGRVAYIQLKQKRVQKGKKQRRGYIYGAVKGHRDAMFSYGSRSVARWR